ASGPGPSQAGVLLGPTCAWISAGCSGGSAKSDRPLNGGMSVNRRSQSGAGPLPVCTSIVICFFAELGCYQSVQLPSPVGSLRRPWPTHNAASLQVRNIASQQDKP